MRWVVRLSEFDLDIQHRKGKKSADVDGLTRDPTRQRPSYDAEVECLYDIQTQNEQKVNTITTDFWKNKIAETREEKEEIKSKTEEAPTEKSEIKETEIKEDEELKRPKPFFDSERDREAYSRSDFIAAQADTTSKSMAFVREHLNKKERGLIYSIQDNLYVVKRDGDDKTRVIVPECLRAHVISTYHNSTLSCHQGGKRTLLQVSEHFYWPGMKNDITRWIAGCLACRKRKTPRPIHAGITEAALSSYPNETVAIDIWGPLPKTEKGNSLVLTMIDTFTRWPVAVPVKDKSSATIANAIFKYWICEKSVPLKIVSDQAREFISKGMKQHRATTPPAIRVSKDSIDT
jgi:hypothetical protein